MSYDPKNNGTLGFVIAIATVGIGAFIGAEMLFKNGVEVGNREKNAFARERLEKFAVRLRFNDGIPKEAHPAIENQLRQEIDELAHGFPAILRKRTENRSI